VVHLEIYKNENITLNFKNQNCNLLFHPSELAHSV